MKRLLVVLMVAALLATLITVPVLAAGTPDALLLETMNVLKGTGNGVDTAYRASVPTRYQAAWLFLRLLGREAGAKASTATANFADAATARTAAGNPLTAENITMLAYLRARQYLGFRGYTDNTFRPFGLITAQEYYKLMLVALGYVEGTDFTWNTVFDKVVAYGLTTTKPSNAGTFNIDKLATATIQALKAKTKSGTMTLIQKLVNVDKSINANLASLAGLYTKAPRTIGGYPLVVGYSAFSEKFSPFFSDTAYDADVAAMTQVALLTTDRTGAIVYNAIQGETMPYNGVNYTYKGIANVKVNYDRTADKTVYTWTIRDDVIFSDGVKMTADDIIFSYYAFADPSYTGSSTLYSVPIVGLADYRTQTTSAVYTKYGEMFDAIYAAGRDHVWSSSDKWTKAQQDGFWSTVKQEWVNDVGAIVSYVYQNYLASYALTYTTYTPAQISAKEGMKVMFGMVMWGYGEIGEDGSLTSSYLKKNWDLKTEFPTLEDYYNETYAAYEGDPDAYWKVEAADSDSVMDAAKPKFIGEWGPKDASLAGKGIPNISGIKKVSSTVVTVTVEGFDATAIYQLGVQVTPLHYYGNVAKYNYANNKFGFTFGDLSSITAKTTHPMGAGAYKFVKYENKVVYFEANEFYYKGEPKTTYVQFKETLDADKISGVGTGTIDVTDPVFGSDAVDEIKQLNSNGLVTGNKIETVTVNNLGYGYIGINAGTVKVGTDPASDASKNLRKALATVIAVYRDLAIDSYYGERASVINYPISNTSWAAPQKSDAGYKVAFSTGVDGNAIYTSSMTATQKYTAALDAAVKYLKAAGFTYNEGTKKFTAAPEGARLEYEIIVPGDGQGNHPSFMVCTKLREAFAKVGITITINDPSNSNVLWDKLDAATQDMWCAAWGSTIDPDMYQVYYSNNIVGNPGSSESNHYHIQDAELDELILAARQSDNQAYRKATYKACLDIIIDWAVEVPIYQRQNCIIFSPVRVDMDTVTPDITTFWGWLNDIELLEVKNQEYFTRN